MNRIFNLDNPLMAFMGKIADLIILNILAIFFSIPIFTIGASWTAMYYVTVKMVKKEESYIFKDFLSSFKNNFKQATIIWIIVLVIVGVFAGDFMIYRAMPDQIPKVLMFVVLIISFIVLCSILYIFPVLSHFDNTIKNTIKNAFLISMINFPSTIVFLILFALPFILGKLTYEAYPFIFMVGFSGPAYLASYLWNRIFKKFESKEREIDYSIDSDTVGDSLQEENGK